jgi:hypothetical protein
MKCQVSVTMVSFSPRGEIIVEIDGEPVVAAVTPQRRQRPRRGHVLQRACLCRRADHPQDHPEGHDVIVKSVRVFAH